MVVGYLDLGLRLVHLVSGEDVIGHVFQAQDGAVKIEKPVVPNIRTDGQRFNVSLMPFRPYVDPDASLHVRGEHVIDVLELGAQMKDLYVQFTSNIKIAGPADIPPVHIIGQ